jgi:hypothetical protein|nr:MAG TPA: hypothetical protein [Caudoviricetes sp.]
MRLPDPIQYTGRIRTRLEDMEIGDIIGCTYSRSKDFKTIEIGSFTDIGKSLKQSDTEFDIRAKDPVYSGGMFLTKVAPGTLFTNSIVMAYIRWIDMARAGLVYGKVVNFGGREFLIRIPKFREYKVILTGLNGRLSPRDDAMQKFLHIEQPSGTKIPVIYAGYELLQDTNNNYIYIIDAGHALSIIDTIRSSGSTIIYNNAHYRFILTYKENPKCTDFWH